MCIQCVEREYRRQVRLIEEWRQCKSPEVVSMSVKVGDKFEFIRDTMLGHYKKGDQIEVAREISRGYYADTKGIDWCLPDPHLFKPVAAVGSAAHQALVEDEPVVGGPIRPDQLRVGDVYKSLTSGDVLEVTAVGPVWVERREWRTSVTPKRKYFSEAWHNLELVSRANAAPPAATREPPCPSCPVCRRPRMDPRPNLQAWKCWNCDHLLLFPKGARAA